MRTHKTDRRVQRVYAKSDAGDLTLDELRKFVADCAHLDGSSSIQVWDVWGGDNGIGGKPFWCKGIETSQTDDNAPADG